MSFCLILCAGIFFSGCSDGKDGLNGKSAYEIWISNGHTGTETDFLEWLKGEDGQTPSIEINADGYWIINGINTCVKARAEVKASQGLKYEFNNDEDAYIVKGMESCTDTDLVIPASYNGKPVEAIGSGAFYGCETITSVTILNGVEKIDDAAFMYCTSIVSVSLPNSINSIGNLSFFSCELLEEINLPNTITSIGNQAFSYCYALNNVVLPSDITKIEDQTFFNCYSLDNLTMGSEIQSIGNMAFQGCKFTTITIPDSVSIIKYRAFFDCNYLEGVVLGSGVVSIGDNAFASCDLLTNVEFTIKTGWFVADSASATSGENVDVSTSAGAAQLVTDTYKDKYFLRNVD